MTPSSHRARSVVRAGLALYLIVLVVYSIAPSSIPGASMTALLPGRDLMAHVLAYGLLTLLLCGATGRRGGSANTGATAAGANAGASSAGANAGATAAGTNAGVTSAGALALGINGILELAQALIPWRAASLRDFAAGLLGTCVALAAWLAFRRAVWHVRPASECREASATASGLDTTQ